MLLLFPHIRLQTLICIVVSLPSAYIISEGKLSYNNNGYCHPRADVKRVTPLSLFRSFGG